MLLKMPEIYRYSVAVLIGVGVFGVVLGCMRLFHARRLRSAKTVIQKLEGTAVRELAKADQPERELGQQAPLPAHPSLYGIPYLAWILTSLVIPATFLILFFENLVVPYASPPVGMEARIAYRALASFQARGRSFVRHEVVVPKDCEKGSRWATGKSWERC
jgi:hypothetical protein